ncbi:MAG: NfeD family protein [Bacteroidales bacterium]|nr:NfeD family protein [Bacteroidales bacterium]
MNWGLVISLIVLGLLSLLLDILVIPGGVVATFGCLMMLCGIVISYVQYGAVAGNITLLSTLVLTAITTVMMLRSKTWNKLMLKTNIDSKMNEVDEGKIAEGMTGVAVSRLAPSGTGKFGDELVEVHSSNDFIDVNSEIVIVKIEGGKIIVKQTK